MRRIAHIDMDAFYASIEVRDNPKLKGKPVIIGGSRYSRNVVSTCSYEARKFGVHSAMATDQAYKLCPNGIFLDVNMRKYKEASLIILSIFKEYTTKIEPLSLDEAYLDISNIEMSSYDFAKEVKSKVLSRVGITCSVGVAPNKFLAKIASEFNKPNGIKIIKKSDQDKIIESLKINSFSGVGKKTSERMAELNIKNGHDLKKKDIHFLVNNFGKLGSHLYWIVRGVDNRQVVVERVCKSISKERTLKEDLQNSNQVSKIMYDLATEVSKVLQVKNIYGQTISIKVKYSDFKVVTRSMTIDGELRDEKEMWYLLRYLFNTHNLFTKKIRLVGVHVSNLKDEGKFKQTYLHLESFG